MVNFIFKSIATLNVGVYVFWCVASATHFFDLRGCYTDGKTGFTTIYKNVSCTAGDALSYNENAK